MPSKAGPKGKEPAKAAGSKRKASGELNAPASTDSARRVTATERWVEENQPSLTDRLAIARSEAADVGQAAKRVRLSDGSVSQDVPSRDFGNAMDLEQIKNYSKVHQSTLIGMTDKFDRLRRQVENLATVSSRTENAVEKMNGRHDEQDVLLISVVDTADRTEEVLNAINGQQDEDSANLAAMAVSIPEMQNTVDAMIDSVYQMRASTSKTEKIAEHIQSKMQMDKVQVTQTMIGLHEVTLEYFRLAGVNTVQLESNINHEFDQMAGKIGGIQEDLEGFQNMAEKVDSTAEKLDEMDEKVDGIQEDLEKFQDIAEKVDSNAVKLDDMDEMMDEMDRKIDDIKEAVVQADRASIKRFNSIASQLRTITESLAGRASA